MITLNKTQDKINVWKNGVIIAQFTSSAKVKPYGGNAVLIQDNVDKYIFEFADLDKANCNPVVTATNVTNFVVEAIASFFPDASGSGTGGGGSATWGDITGTLSNQTDLQNALNLKANLSLVIQNESITSVTDIDFTKNQFFFNDDGTATAEIFTFSFTNTPKVGATFIALKNNTSLNSIPASGIQAQIGSWKADTDQTFIFTYLGNNEVFLNVIDQIDLDSILGSNPEGGSGTVQRRFELGGRRAYIPIPFQSGKDYDNTLGGAGGQGTTQALAVGQIVLSPFYFDGVEDLAFTRMGTIINTAGTSGTGAARVLVYDCNDDGTPNQLIKQVTISGLNSGSGTKDAALVDSMLRGVPYWVGIHSDSDAIVRTVSAQNTSNMGRQSATGSGYYKRIIRTLSYASGSPATWVWNPAELDANSVPIVSWLAA